MSLKIIKDISVKGEMNFLSSSENSTLLLGKTIGSLLDAGTVVSLNGDLGTGKTVLIRGIASGLGCRGRIVSPTFTLLMEHMAGENLNFCHFDVYRLSGGDEFMAAGLDEYLGRDDTICVIEWGGIIDDILPVSAITIGLMAGDPQKPDERKINVYWPEKINKLAQIMQTEIDNVNSGS